MPLAGGYIRRNLRGSLRPLSFVVLQLSITLDLARSIFIISPGNVLRPGQRHLCTSNIYIIVVVMAPERQKAKGMSKIRSKLRDRRGVVSSSSSSSPNIHATRPQNTILRYLQSSSPLPVAAGRRTPSIPASSGTLRSDFSSVTSSSSTSTDRLGNNTGIGSVAINPAFPELSSPNISSPINDSLGNARFRRGRDVDKPASSGPPVRQQYGQKECIPGTLFQTQTLTY